MGVGVVPGRCSSNFSLLERFKVGGGSKSVRFQVRVQVSKVGSRFSVLVEPRLSGGSRFQGGFDSRTWNLP